MVMTKSIQTFITALFILLLGGGMFFYFKNNSSTKNQYKNGNYSSTTSQSNDKVSSSTAKLDISSHNNKNDCWMIIDGQTYDLTSFIDSHPGGKAILKGCGKDATEMYKGVSAHGNPGSGDNLAKYKI